MRRQLSLLLILFTVPFVAAAQNRPHQTENVFLIISDGLRWQEVFNGAEELLLNKTNGGVKNVPVLQTNFWRATPELRRAALFPFFWSEIARRGQLYGNQPKGSVASVMNTRKFSYPGYNELLTGFADPKIDSNDKKPNVNVTVYEWFHNQPDFRRRVVAFGTWDVFPYIFNQARSGIPVWPPWEMKFADTSVTASPALVSLMADTTPILEGVILDSFLFHAAVDHIQQKKPRLAFIGFGETDEWAHAGRYDLYLESAHNVDRFVQGLWDTVQGIPQYRDKTTFIVSADHGRGSGLTGWKDHGEKVRGAEGIWLAVIGPDTPPLGERSQTAPVTQSQIAATIAALLGQDYQSAFPRAGAPIADLLAGGGTLAGRNSK
jgi:Metalloenzyme superfamily